MEIKNELVKLDNEKLWMLSDFYAHEIIDYYDRVTVCEIGIKVREFIKSIIDKSNKDELECHLYETDYNSKYITDLIHQFGRKVKRIDNIKYGLVNMTVFERDFVLNSKNISDLFSGTNINVSMHVRFNDFLLYPITDKSVRTLIHEIRKFANDTTGVTRIAFYRSLFFKFYSRCIVNSILLGIPDYYKSTLDAFYNLSMHNHTDNDRSKCLIDIIEGLRSSGAITDESVLSEVNEMLSEYIPDGVTPSLRFYKNHPNITKNETIDKTKPILDNGEVIFIANNIPESTIESVIDQIKSVTRNTVLVESVTDNSNVSFDIPHNYKAAMMYEFGEDVGTVMTKDLKEYLIFNESGTPYLMYMNNHPEDGLCIEGVSLGEKAFSKHIYMGDLDAIGEYQIVCEGFNNLD